LELTSRLARLLWEVLDRIDYAVALARCWAVDRIYGPEPPTSADKQREAKHGRLREAFTVIDLAGTIEVDGESRTYVEPGAIGPARVSEVVSTRPEVPTDRPVD
jgi:hypothetical protein